MERDLYTQDYNSNNSNASEYFEGSDDSNYSNSSNSSNDSNYSNSSNDSNDSSDSDNESNPSSDNTSSHNGSHAPGLNHSTSTPNLSTSSDLLFMAEFYPELFVFSTPNPSLNYQYLEPGQLSKALTNFYTIFSNKVRNQQNPNTQSSIKFDQYLRQNFASVFQMTGQPMPTATTTALPIPPQTVPTIEPMPTFTTQTVPTFEQPMPTTTTTTTTSMVPGFSVAEE